MPKKGLRKSRPGTGVGAKKTQIPPKGCQVLCDCSRANEFTVGFLRGHSCIKRMHRNMGAEFGAVRIFSAQKGRRGPLGGFIDVFFHSCGGVQAFIFPADSFAGLRNRARCMGKHALDSFRVLGRLVVGWDRLPCAIYGLRENPTND